MQPLLRPDRRTVLTSLSFGAIALSTRESFAQGVDRWFPIKGDDGKPVANLRLPVELTSEVDELKGLIRIGAKQPDVTVVEFYDYNCPFCRKAAGVRPPSPPVCPGDLPGRVLRPWHGRSAPSASPRGASPVPRRASAGGGGTRCWRR